MFNKLKKLVYLENLTKSKGAETIFIDSKRRNLYPYENEELSRWDLY